MSEGWMHPRLGEVLRRAYFEDQLEWRLIFWRMVVFLMPWPVLRWYESRTESVCWACLAGWRMGMDIGDPWEYVTRCREQGAGKLPGYCWCGKFQGPKDE